MSVPLNLMANDTPMRQSRWGFEAQRGVPGTIDYKMYGQFVMNRDRPQVKVAEDVGSYAGSIEPGYGHWRYSGTYAQSLTYEDAIALMALGVRGGIAGVSDSESPAGYLWNAEPTLTFNDLASVTVQHGFPGMVFESEMVMFNDWTISGNIDDAEAFWKFSANTIARVSDLLPGVAVTATGGTTSTLIDSGASWATNQYAGSYLTILTATQAGIVNMVVPIASNNGTTLTLAVTLPATVTAADTAVISAPFTSVSDRSREYILMPGTQFFRDAIGGTIGTTPVPHGLIGFSLTHNNALDVKAFAPDGDYMSRKVGRGELGVTGQITLEFDNRDQYDLWQNKTPSKIRIQQQGSELNDHVTLPNKLARLDVHRAIWGTPTMGTRRSNITATYPFRGYLNVGDGKLVSYAFKNALSAQF